MMSEQDVLRLTIREEYKIQKQLLINIKASIVLRFHNKNKLFM